MSIDIGFLEETDSILLKSHHFPSKVGGFPAWLSLKDLPKPSELQCVSCSNQMIFLCQIYAPYEGDDDNFHRTLFVFVCRNPDCCKRNENDSFKVFRSRLKRENDFYDYEPPTDKSEFQIEKFVKLCALCGNYAEKHCSKCKDTHYCTREHQVLDWRSGHKTFCQDRNAKTKNEFVYPEFELVIKEEKITTTDRTDEEKLNDLNKLVTEDKIETLPDVSELDLDAHADVTADKTFLLFKKRIDHYPEQVLRYNRGGEPLLIADEPKPVDIPNCEFCGSERQFEFQILPQLLFELKEERIDWGTLMIYTCKRSCGEGPEYKREFLFKQDVME